MKQLIFLLLFPCLATAQYQGNGNQKITLGEQTSADGLVWRGRTSDTVNLMTSKLDTSAYLVLDTITEAIWLYRASTTPKWNRVVDSLNNLQGQLSLTTKVTGVLPVANGGTGENMSSLPNNYLIRKNSSGIFDTAAIFESGGNVGIGTNAPTNNLSILGSGIAATRLLIDGNGCQGTTPSGCITDLVLRRTTGRGFAFQILSDSLTDTNFNVESTVSGANQMRLRTDSNLSGMNFINGSSTAPIRFIQDLTPRLIINSGGEILIGYQSNQDNGAYRLQVNSQIFATNATIATSDIKFKENIQPLDKGLEIINKLKPVKFNFITTTENNFSEFDEIGFIAQDVEGALSTELFAKAVVKKLDENKDDSALGLMTEKFIPILVKAIQEQQALIKALEQRIINLENK